MAKIGRRSRHEQRGMFGGRRRRRWPWLLIPMALLVAITGSFVVVRRFFGSN